MEYLLLAVATVCASAKAILCKLIGQDSTNVRQMSFLNANLFLASALTILLCFINNVRGIFEISGYTLLLSLIFAVFLLFTQITQIYAMTSGFASLSSLIYACGFLIPILYSAAFLGESISVFQVVGIVILVGSLAVILPPSKEGKFSFVWLFFAIASMLGSGIAAVIQKVHQSSDFKAEVSSFTFYSLIFAAAFSLIISLIAKGDGKARRIDLYSRKVSILLIILGGAVVGVANFANLKLAGQLPAVIQFPVYNILSMILTAVAGRVCFGERIGLRKLVGFVIGLGAITIIGLM